MDSLFLLVENKGLRLTKLCQSGPMGQIGSQEKRLILSWKVRENEFCRVVGTMYFSHPDSQLLALAA